MSDSQRAYRRDINAQIEDHNAAMRAEANWGRDVWPGDDDTPTRRELEAEEREWRGGRDW